MNAHDFTYNGIRLSDLGYTICSIDGGGGVETVASGSQITFDTVPIKDGRKFNLTGTRYESVIEAVFQICKLRCDDDDLSITVEEMRGLLRWLGARTYRPLRFNDSEYDSYYFNAMFNVGQINFDDKIIGLELTMTTDSPFAYQTYKITTEGSGAKTLSVRSDLEETFSPDSIEIAMLASGDLTLKDAMSNKLKISNCSSGEIIHIANPVITTSSGNSHDIKNDFNWVFPVLVSMPTLQSNATPNQWTTNLNCNITVTYKGMVRVIL